MKVLLYLIIEFMKIDNTIFKHSDENLLSI